ncbi:hypothetical protein NC653_033047 [Populus alba x Populus x berolinensis]|uniref:Uncharacterized protein n=1 Tax=Populus alba x Populus x berolinensis TaxID=444605 RepID=A0AAD6PYP0_9ROSI|nr:hypothetical protein NC653_033047 [Populus alba x Populus x berolinensis]
MPGASNTTQLDLSDFEEPENPLTALQIFKNQNLRQLTVFSWRTRGWEVKSRIHGLNLLLDAVCQRNHLATKPCKRWIIKIPSEHG